MRNRAKPSIEIAYCSSRSVLNCSTCSSDIVPSTMLVADSFESGSRLTGLILPLTLMHGGAPTVTNRSEPLSSCSIFSQLSITLIAGLLVCLKPVCLKPVCRLLLLRVLVASRPCRFRFAGRIRRTPSCRPPCGAPRAWPRGRGAPVPTGSGRALPCRRSGRSGWPNTSARPCPLESGCGWPASRS